MKSARKQKQNVTRLFVEALANLAELENLLRAGLADGSIKDGGPDHRNIQRAIRDLHNSIGTGAKKTPP